MLGTSVAVAGLLSLSYLASRVLPNAQTPASYTHHEESSQMTRLEGDAFQEDLVRWEYYLRSITEPFGLFSIEHVARLRRVWGEIVRRVGAFCPLPITQSTGDKSLQLAWDNGLQYVDIEITPEGFFHWYFRDRNSGEVLGTGDKPMSTIADEFLVMSSKIIETLR